MINLGFWIRHVMPVGIKTQRREKWHEKHLRLFWIRNPNRLSLFTFAATGTIVQKRSHKPIFYTVLPFDTRIRRPTWQILAGHRQGVGTIVVQHADVEPPREIVHINSKRSCTGLRSGGWLQQRKEVWSKIDGSDEDWVRNYEKKNENDREYRFSKHFGHLWALIMLTSRVSLVGSQN